MEFGIRGVCVVLLMVTWVSGQTSFTIDKTWNNAPISDDKKVTLTVTTSDATEMVVIDFSAPYYNDAAPSTPEQRQELWKYEGAEFFFANCLEQSLQIILSPHGHSLVLLYNGKWNYVGPFPRYTVAAATALKSPTRWEGQLLVPFKYFPKEATLFNAVYVSGVPPNQKYLSLYPAPSDAANPDNANIKYYQTLPSPIVNSLLFTNKHYSQTWKTALSK